MEIVCYWVDTIVPKFVGLKIENQQKYSNQRISNISKIWFENI
jgi:hypothetical protein